MADDHLMQENADAVDPANPVIKYESQNPDDDLPPKTSLTPISQPMTVAELASHANIDEDQPMDFVWAICVASSDLSKSERKEIIYINGNSYVIKRCVMAAWRDASQWPGKWKTCVM